MTRSIDEVLARAVLAGQPLNYSQQEMEAAESRIAARVADRAHPEAARARPRRGTRAAEIARHLETLCRTVVEQDGALQHMAALLGGRIPEPDGARVLGCVLQLAGLEDSARFWWQFAAGAGDGAAAYCLYLHHLTLGEEWEAELWHRQADPDRHPHGLMSETEDGSDPALVLRVLALLRGEPCLTAAAAAVVHYVPEAIRFVDEIELPLPADDFAQRIEELTA
ncbi:hypothetical protein [Streptomyces hainanensis]|uniref:Uncharacterized protein n=1 Tax=Streptomyces hainanensis TaxID=402648 RepID=A0A4R4SXL8_9ACTN|nr:hypothetical protein [Streptomyces hainanensis]TDC66743.1 hypothetical protein E1283_29495 [Streptomyces hainanensis]